MCPDVRALDALCANACARTCVFWRAERTVIRLHHANRAYCVSLRTTFHHIWRSTPHRDSTQRCLLTRAALCSRYIYRRRAIDCPVSNSGMSRRRASGREAPRSARASLASRIHSLSSFDARVPAPSASTSVLEADVRASDDRLFRLRAWHSPMEIKNSVLGALSILPGTDGCDTQQNAPSESKIWIFVDDDARAALVDAVALHSSATASSWTCAHPTLSSGPIHGPVHSRA